MGRELLPKGIKALPPLTQYKLCYLALDVWREASVHIIVKPLLLLAKEHQGLRMLGIGYPSAYTSVDGCSS